MNQTNIFSFKFKGDAPNKPLPEIALTITMPHFECFLHLKVSINIILKTTDISLLAVKSLVQVQKALTSLQGAKSFHCFPKKAQKAKY